MKRIGVVSVLAVALLGGCHRGPSSHGQPAPSASVITLAVTIGGCEDVEACERECDAGSADRVGDWERRTPWVRE